MAIDECVVTNESVLAFRYNVSCWTHVSKREGLTNWKGMNTMNTILLLLQMYLISQERFTWTATHGSAYPGWTWTRWAAAWWPRACDGVRSGGEGTRGFAPGRSPQNSPNPETSRLGHHSTVFKVKDTQGRFQRWPSLCHFTHSPTSPSLSSFICKQLMKIAFLWGLNEMVYVKRLTHCECLRNRLNIIIIYLFYLFWD